jgi:hypothetical protein
MNNQQFMPEYRDFVEGEFENADVDFWNVEGYPVINVFDGKTGMVALFGKIRNFPLDSAYKNGWEVSREEFFKLFPQTRCYFEKAIKNAA